MSEKKTKNQTTKVIDVNTPMDLHRKTNGEILRYRIRMREPKWNIEILRFPQTETFKIRIWTMAGNKPTTLLNINTSRLQYMIELLEKLHQVVKNYRLITPQETEEDPLEKLLKQPQQ